MYEVKRWRKIKTGPQVKIPPRGVMPVAAAIPATRFLDGLS